MPDVNAADDGMPAQACLPKPYGGDAACRRM
jgi:hypothetical protein